MKSKKTPSPRVSHLRQKAEKALATTRAQVKKMAPEKVQQLVHELQVHQIELEMQNEELRQTQVELEVARDRYATLFDSTPVGNATLDGTGRILEANLTLCQLVGVSRKDILRKKFEEFLEPENQAPFRRHLDDLKTKAGTHSSDVLTFRHGETPRRVRLESFLEAVESSSLASLYRVSIVDVSLQEEMKAEQEMQSALLKVAMGKVKDAIVTTDENERIVLFNEAAANIFRCTASSAIGQSIDRFIPQRFRVAHHKHLRQFGKQEEAPSQMGLTREITGLRSDGEEFPIEATISQVEVKGKGKKLFTVVLRDLTGRQQVQKALKKERQFISEILNTVGALVVVLDRQGHIVQFNPACENLTGFSFEEVKGRLWWEKLLPPTDPEKVKEYFHTLVQGQVSKFHENYWVTKDGKLRWIAWSNGVLRNEHGAVDFVIATGINLTKQRRMQRALKKEQRFIANVLDTAGAFVIILNTEWRVLHMNRVCEQTIQHSLQSVRGQPFWDLLVMAREDDTGARQVLESYHAGRVPATFESTLLDKSHRLRWIQWTTTAIYAETGEVEYFIVTGTDMTVRKQAEQDLRVTHQQLERQQQELRSLAAQLLTVQEEERRRISRDLHDDVNQRLALLSLKLQTAEKGLPDSHPVTPMLKELYENVADLSDDIRHLAYQYHPSILDDLGLGTALRSLFEDFAKYEAVSVTWELPERGREFSQAVATCLYRVAQESLRNVSRHAQASAAHLVLKDDEEGVTLSIRDNGQGFKVDGLLSRGLGFVSMKERVRLVGGTLWVDSQPGQGTTVSVVIPDSAHR